jgi:hypothetical protein
MLEPKLSYGIPIPFEGIHMVRTFVSEAQRALPNTILFPTTTLPKLNISDRHQCSPHKLEQNRCSEDSKKKSDGDVM